MFLYLNLASPQDSISSFTLCVELVAVVIIKIYINSLRAAKLEPWYIQSPVQSLAIRHQVAVIRQLTFSALEQNYNLRDGSQLGNTGCFP